MQITLTASSYRSKQKFYLHSVFNRCHRRRFSYTLDQAFWKAFNTTRSVLGLRRVQETMQIKIQDMFKWQKLRPVHTGQLMRIEPDWIPIHFQRWFCSRLNWIAQLRLAREDQKGRGMHAHRQWARFSGYTLCSTYMFNLRTNMMAGGSKDLTRALW